jgi:glycine dehydrogenase
MIEPTESESISEIDRFVEAMISIKKEINNITDKQDNLLKNAPHTVVEATKENWNHTYSRKSATFPSIYQFNNKFWPPVGRVDNAYGDRNLVCSCLPLESYEEESKKLTSV